ncbi:hypothetical protein FHX81_1879 [Saccharothrix saharensis]|uniref:Uncharacterized protein n=1 Tax=Saccharothrix saharensis TaxID=571190 RepID=A0A543J9R7_9PSEU|nr:hypothetical protein [Saccharothrix saharensis]TQM79570.1 hypothetical protein FHX81_1879 [Saccharothrix saharensis]
MFGTRDEALYTRVRELEGRVERLTGLLGKLTDDEERYARLHGLAERTDGALRSLEARAASVGVGQPRFQAALDTVYHAKTFGYVAVFFVGGRTSRLRLLVGTANPPETSVGYADSSADLNSYMGVVVRPGEYWMVSSPRPGREYGFECVFTPIF